MDFNQEQKNHFFEAFYEKLNKLGKDAIKGKNCYCCTRCGYRTLTVKPVGVYVKCRHCGMYIKTSSIPQYAFDPKPATPPTDMGTPYEFKSIKRTIQITDNGCFEVGNKIQYGWPRAQATISINGERKPKPLSRLVYEMSYGEISDEMIVRHKCDNPICINPTHLEVGTVQDNVDDRVRRGRSARGESHGRAKLTEKDVRKIKIELQNTNRTISGIASEFGVTEKAIAFIRDGVNWSHVQ